MNKKEQIQAVSHKNKLTKEQAGKMVNKILSGISEALTKGEEVKKSTTSALFKYSKRKSAKAAIRRQGNKSSFLLQKLDNLKRQKC